MKNTFYLLAAFFCLPLAFGFEPPTCYQLFSYDMAWAHYNFDNNMEYCESAAFYGPCATEAEAAFRSAMNAALRGFDRCCLECQCC